MPSRKTVRIYCYEPVAKYPEAQQPWSDVYLSFKAKPGRKVYRYAPTITTLAYMKIMNDFMVLGGTLQPEYSDALIQLVEKNGILIDTTEHGKPDMPEIFVSNDYLDRLTIEGILRIFLKTLQIGNVKFKWDKPSIIVTPT